MTKKLYTARMTRMNEEICDGLMRVYVFIYLTCFISFLYMFKKRERIML